MIAPDFEKYKIAKGGKFYWSGKECAVKLGNIWLDESVQLGLQIVENVTPHYHYSEFTARKITHGTRSIMGEISMNFNNFSDVFSTLKKGSETSTPAPDTTEKVPAVVLGSIIPTIEVSNPDSLKAYANNYKTYLENRKESARVEETSGDISSLFDTGTKLNLDIIFGMHVARDRIINTRLGRNWDEKGDWVSSIFTKVNSPGTGIRLLDFHIISYNMLVDDSGRHITTTSQFIAKNIQQIN